MQMTALGRAIRATANHKFLTIDGWKRLDALEAGGPYGAGWPAPRVAAGPVSIVAHNRFFIWPG